MKYEMKSTEKCSIEANNKPIIANNIHTFGIFISFKADTI